MSASPARPTLGTFLGVYTPSILTILGVVLFLRAGWVVGNVGLHLDSLAPVEVRLVGGSEVPAVG